MVKVHEWGDDHPNQGQKVLDLSIGNFGGWDAMVVAQQWVCLLQVPLCIENLKKV